MGLETLKTDGAPPIVTSRSLTAVPCKNPRGNQAERTAAERGRSGSRMHEPIRTRPNLVG